MCNVRIQRYECPHWVHVIEKTCPDFDKILNNAHTKPGLLQAHRCEKLGNKVSWCQDVKPHGTLPPTKMVGIEKVEGPWIVAGRNIVGGHCAKPDFQLRKDPAPRLKGWCADCTKKMAEKTAELPWYRRLLA